MVGKKLKKKKPFMMENFKYIQKERGQCDGPHVPITLLQQLDNYQFTANFV